MIELTCKVIDTDSILQQAATANVGAVLLFLGVTRQFTDQKETVELKYEAYEEMALQELQKLEIEARQKWQISECMIIHRLGTVPSKEASVAIITASAHRRDAFEAGQWLIDTLKERVPIWKKEHWADGSTDWVHPIEK